MRSTPSKVASQYPSLESGQHRPHNGNSSRCGFKSSAMAKLKVYISHITQPQLHRPAEVPHVRVSMTCENGPGGTDDLQVEPRLRGREDQTARGSSPNLNKNIHWPGTGRFCLCFGCTSTQPSQSFVFNARSTWPNTMPCSNMIDSPLAGKINSLPRLYSLEKTQM